MRRAPLFALFMVFTACGASQVPQSAPPGEAPPASPPATTAATTASPPATATATATATTSASDEIPPIEDACTRDDECTVVGPASGTTACCNNQCDETPVRKDWVPKFRAACDARAARRHPAGTGGAWTTPPDCPTMICGGVPRQNPHCVSGHCVVR